MEFKDSPSRFLALMYMCALLQLLSDVINYNLRGINLAPAVEILEIESKSQIC